MAPSVAPTSRRGACCARYQGRPTAEYRWPLAVDATSGDVLIGAGEFQIERWDAGLNAPAATAELDAPIAGAAFDPSGERVAVLTFDPPRIELLDAHDARRRSGAPTRSPTRPASLGHLMARCC